MEQLQKVGTVNENIKQLEKVIATMKEIETSKWLTNGKLLLSIGTIDVKTETSIEKLVMGYANAKHAEKVMQEAYAEMGINEYPLIKIGGNSVEDIKHDVNLRIQIIQQKDKLDFLTTMKKEFEELMDKEERKVLLEDKLSNFLKSFK